METINSKSPLIPHGKQSTASRFRGRLVKISGKLIAAVSRIILPICFCSPSKHSSNDDGSDADHSTLLCDLPNELLHKVISHCDFSTQMNLRAVNYRLHWLIESSHHVRRRQFVGGVEIACEDERSLSPTPSMHHSPSLLSLRRPSKPSLLMVPLARFAYLMKHVCVCHSLKVRGVALDESIAKSLLTAKFRAMRDLFIDRLHSVEADTLTALIHKVGASHSLVLLNHSSPAESAIAPLGLAASPTQHIAIHSSPSTLLHPLFDDTALLSLVLSDAVAGRALRLPRSAITHHGILAAAVAFHSRCMQVLSEQLGSPRWEVLISLPWTALIDSACLLVPFSIQRECKLWKYLHSGSFTLEVRIERMILLINVDDESTLA